MLSLIASFFLATTPQEQSNAALIKKMFENVSEKMTIEYVADYFNDDLQLTSNNHFMDYRAFKDHLVYVFGMLKSIQIKKPLDEVIAKDDKVITRFTITAIDKDDKEHETKVIAIYEIKNGKISHWRELTYPAWKGDLTED